MQVRFNLKNPTSTDKTLVLAVFRYDGKKLVYSFNEHIEPKNWNPKTQRAKKTKYFDPLEFNSRLDNLSNEILKIYRKYKNDGVPLPLSTFRNELDKVTHKERAAINEVPKKFFPFYDYFIETRSKRKDEYSNATIKQYKVTYNHLKAYTKHKNTSLEFASFNVSFYDNLITYLYEKKGLSINYVGNIIKTIKTVLGDARRSKVNKYTDYLEYTKPKQETDNVYLGDDELKTMYQYDFSNDSRLERVRDTFIIGAFTGVRFSDFQSISQENIKTIYDPNGKPYQLIDIRAQKTGQNISIPLHQYVRSIIAKYEGTPPIISNQKMNEYIKEVAEIVGITETVSLQKSKSGKKYTLTEPKYKLISTHTARRSFATNAYKAGVPSISIMAITGHKTETAFMRYIKLSKQEHGLVMAQNRFFQTSPLKVAK